MSYRIDGTLAALHYRKAMYQRSVLLAWLIVVLFIALPAAWLLYPEKTPSAILRMVPAGTMTGPEPGIAGGRSRGGDSFMGQANVHYRIVRESPLGAPTVAVPTYAVSTGIYSEGPADPIGRPDIAYSSGSGVGTGNGVGSGFADFGLPGRPIFARTLGRAGWPGGGRERFDAEGVGSPALIEWIAPERPRKAPPNAEVYSLVSLEADGAKTIEVVRSELWTFVGGERTTVQFWLGPDPWGFADAVVSALDASMFWPATDGWGRPMAGKFLIKWRFCPQCPPETQQVHVERGDVVLRPGRP